MKSDARIRYTKMVIRNALLQLMQEKAIKQITVKELCEISEINRATFYSHYADVYDLRDQIQNELYSQIESALNEVLNPSITNIVEQVLSVIYNQAELCKILFSEYGDKVFFRKIQEAGEASSIAVWQAKYPHASPETLKTLYIYISSGSISLIENWIKTGLCEHPTVMG